MAFRRLIPIVLAGFCTLSAGTALADFDDGAQAMRVGQYAVAFDQWRRAAEGGDARSQYGLGYLYQFGLGVSADDLEAKAWYQKAADQGEPNALFALGLIYEAGR